MTRPSMFGIYREPGRQARRRRDEVARAYAIGYTPRPKRVAVIEAATQADALTAFAKAEEIRSSHVRGWHIAARSRLVMTLANGQAVHEAVFVAWKQS